MVLTLSPATTFYLKVCTSVLQGLAFLFTIFRLWLRYKIHRLWWEDVWAAIALCSGASGLMGLWIFLKTTGESYMVGVWIYAFAFTCTVWFVRMSLLCSILRIVYSSQRLRRMILAIAVLFALMWAGLIAQKLYKCTTDMSWQSTPQRKDHQLCRLSSSMAAYELFTDITSDAILILTPIRLLWNVKLPRKQRRMILLIFSSNIVMTMLSIFHAVCMLAHITALTSTTTDFESGLSLFICNLLVIVTFSYRKFRRGLRNGDPEATTTESDSEDDDYTAPTRSSSAPQFTTVDLSALTRDKTQSGAVSGMLESGDGGASFASILV
ncbi:hypothetical protein HYDPIDRAFT_175806 [Hydnomerulius pinastri MD-312]|uniref:Rhodopsin domain-containing protein n=1 Tax=Hydnomerulius pinastri MD-312 TaxID=994086 RepID=A0A0C9VF21_9AGAM|nr:hypothetical protein HYDPIDRAFT_175806 [Hydnomerulius pinastri MD-312]